MKKILVVLLSALLSISLFGCSKEEQTETKEDEQVVTENTEVQEESDIDNQEKKKIVIKSLTTINIRDGHSIDSEKVGFIRKGDILEVYEQYNDGEYIWNRIGKNYWIADDGTYLEQVNEDVNLINTNIEFYNIRKLPNRIDEYLIFADYIRKFETYFEKDQNGNIIGYKELWYVGTDYSSEHSGDNYRFGTNDHLYFGKTTTHEYDNNGNVIKEDLVSTQGNHAIKTFEYDGTKLVKENNYQFDYPSNVSLWITDFYYNENGQLYYCVNSFESEDNVDEIGYYEYNNNLVFYYSGFVRDLDVYGEENCSLCNVYRFDDNGILIEDYNENGDHCHIDSLYYY